MNNQTGPDLSIVIPFYNEEANVEGVIVDVVQSLSQAKVDYEIVAVNNGSTDKTGALLEEIKKNHPQISICTVHPNRGYGWGIISGLQQTRGRFVGYIWGDRQIDAASLVEIYQELKQNRVDFCKAKRVKKSRLGFYRKSMSWIYNLLFFLMFGVRSSDINGCPKIMKREVYLKVMPQSKDWFIDAEIMIKLKRFGYTFSEVPVVSKKREKGKSKVRLATAFEFVKNMLKARLGMLS